MPSKDRKRRNETSLSSARFLRSLAADEALEAAQLLIRPKTPCIAYYRVYSEKPPRPAYEREAQRRAVERIVTGAGATLIAVYDQPEKHGPGMNKRRQLGAALAACQARGAMLIIAKLGRLVASAPILSQLAASGVDFVACDKPHVNHRTVEALAVAEQRKEQLRTEHKRAAWAALKATGYRHSVATYEAGRRANEAFQLQARLFYVEIAPFLEAARRNSCRTLEEIAAALNSAGIKTRRGCRWNRTTVRRALRRADDLTPNARQIAAAATALNAKADSPAAASAAAPAAPGVPAPTFENGEAGRGFRLSSNPKFAASTLAVNGIQTRPDRRARKGGRSSSCPGTNRTTPTLRQ